MSYVIRLQLPSAEQLLSVPVCTAMHCPAPAVRLVFCSTLLPVHVVIAAFVFAVAFTFVMFASTLVLSALQFPMLAVMSLNVRLLVPKLTHVAAAVALMICSACCPLHVPGYALVVSFINKFAVRFVLIPFLLSCSVAVPPVVLNPMLVV